MPRSERAPGGRSATSATPSSATTRRRSCSTRSPSTLDELTARLGAGAPRDRATVRSGEEWKRGVAVGTRLESYDDRPFSGRSSPWGVDLEVHRHGDEIEARLHAARRPRGRARTVARRHRRRAVRRRVRVRARRRRRAGVHRRADDPLRRGRRRCTGRSPAAGAWRGATVASCTSRASSSTSRRTGEPVVARGRSIFITVDPAVFAESTAKLPAPPDERF